MISQTGPTATSARFPIDIRRLPWIRRLATDYVYEHSRVAPFFSGNPGEAGAWTDAIARTQSYERDREAIVAVLEAQQRRRRAPSESVAAASQLRDAQAVAVVTGQQAALFGGPLFTLLKAVTAIQVADRLRASHRIPVVPVFWVEAEDHDWNEVRSCGLFDAQMAFRRVSLGELPGAGERAVAQIQLDGSADRALSELESSLPATEFTTGLLEALRRAYRAGAGMADAFATWLESVLGRRGLVVYDAADPAAKPLVSELFAREIERGSTTRLAVQAGAELEALGYHAQAAAPPVGLALFHLDGIRQPIRQQGDVFLVGDEQLSRTDLAARARAKPQMFSPNVLLRPLVQDTLFPTVCYVAGPNELAYLAQLRRVYESFGTPMPLIYQRASATVLDSNAMRFLTRHDIPLEALQARDEAALNALLASQLPPGVEASLQDAARAADERMSVLAREVVQIDPTLEGAARSTLGRIQDELKKLHGKIIQAAKRKDETLRRQFRHAQAQAFPDGQPQEREVGFVYFLNKYGPAFTDRLFEELPPEMGAHWVVTI